MSSRTIEERVVEMQFDNQNFEKNVQTSLGTLEKLKNSLNFSGTVKGIDKVEDASKKFSMENIANAIDSISNKFSGFEFIGLTALQNITNKAVDTGLRLAKSLSIDQVTEGWSKYEELTTATQTIIAATGKDIDYVEERLEKLNWFTDETSYNLTDMVSNVGKFTSAGVDLDKAVTAMQGIATEAALSGANAQQASRAMYNFSQALGLGSVRVQDWMSIENANMATKEFKQTIIETAKELGYLDSTYHITEKGMANAGSNFKAPKEGVNFQNFRSTLAGGWFDSKVLEESLSKYGTFSDKLNKYTDETGKTASEMLKYVDQYKKGTVDFGTVSKETGVDAKRLGEIFKDLGSKENELGYKAFRAAQEAKTFTDVINATKDAVSTKWATTFKMIFGNYEEAKVFFTDLAEALYDVFAASGDVRNALLKGWKDDGGRDKLIESFWNLWEAISAVVKPIKDAFQEIFFPKGLEETIGPKLMEITDRILKFTESLKPNEEVLNNIKRTFKGFFAILDIGKQLLSALSKPFGQLIARIRDWTDRLLGSTASLGDWLVKLDESIKKNKTFEGVIDKIHKKFSGFLDIIEKVAGAFVLLFNKVSNSKLLEKFDISGVLDKSTASLDKFIESIKNFFTNNKFFSSLLDGITSVASTLVSTISSIIDSLGTQISNAAKNGNVFDIEQLFEASIVAGIIKAVQKFVSGIATITDSASGIASGVTGILSAIEKTLEVYQTNLNADTLRKIAVALGIMAASILILSYINPDNLGSAIAGLAIAAGGLAYVFKTIQNVVKTVQAGGLKEVLKVSQAYTALIKIAAALLIISVALKIISTINPDQMTNSLMAVVIMLFSLSSAMGVLSKLNENKIQGSGTVMAFAVSILIIAAAMKLIGSMDWNSYKQALGAVEALLATMAIAIGVLSKINGKKIQGSGTVIAFAVSILIIAAAMKIIGSMDWNSYKQALGAVEALLATMAIAIGVLSKINGKKVQGSGTVIAFAVSILIIAAAMKIIGSMDWNSYKQALGAVIASLVLMVAAMAIMSKISGTGASGAAFVAMAASLLVIAAAMKILSTIPFKAAAIAIGSLVVVLAALIGAAAIISSTGLLPVLLGLAGTITLLGLGCLAAGVGVLAFATGLAALGAAMAASGAGIYAFVVMIIDLIPLIVQKLFEGIGLLLQDLFMLIPVVIDLAGQLILGILEGLLGNIGQIVSTGLKLIVALIQGITEGLPQLIDAAFELVITFIESMADSIEKNGERFADAVVRLIFAVLRTLGTFVIKFGRAAIDFLKEMGAKIKENFPLVVDKIKELGKNIVDKIKEKISSITQAGKDLIQGFIDGIGAKIQAAVDKVKSLGDKVVGGLKNILGINSPSKVFRQIGIYSDQGLINGLMAFASRVAKTGAYVGKEAIDSISKPLNDISSVFSNVDANPTIRPTVDLSDAEYGAAQLSSLFTSSNIPYNIAALTSAQAAQQRKIQNEQNYMDRNYVDKDSFNDAIGSLGSEFSELKEYIRNMKVVLSTGQTVGGLLPEIDRQMGVRLTHKGRGSV